MNNYHFLFFIYLSINIPFCPLYCKRKICLKISLMNVFKPSKVISGQTGRKVKDVKTGNRSLSTSHIVIVTINYEFFTKSLKLFLNPLYSIGLKIITSSTCNHIKADGILYFFICVLNWTLQRKICATKIITVQKKSFQLLTRITALSRLPPCTKLKGAWLWVHNIFYPHDAKHYVP